MTTLGKEVDFGHERARVQAKRVVGRREHKKKCRSIREKALNVEGG